MRLGLVQLDSQFAEVSQNIDTALSLMSGQKADLWVLPELFNTGYQFRSKDEVRALSESVPEGQTSQKLLQAARDMETTIVAGLAEQAGDHFFNAALCVGPEGLISVYRKIHLFYEETRWFTPGDRPFEVHDIHYQESNGARASCRIGIMICFDWIFPESARTLALLRADVICHPSNLVLPHCPQAMVTRCLENRVFAATANRIGSESRGCNESGDVETLDFIGQSQLVSPQGEILGRASGDKAGVQVIEIDPHRARNKQLNKYNNLFSGRREQFYA